MSQDSQIQIRVSTELREQAQEVFEGLGISLSAGIKLYLNHVTQTKKLPFTPQATVRPKSKKQPKATTPTPKKETQKTTAKSQFQVIEMESWSNRKRGAE